MAIPGFSVCSTPACGIAVPRPGVGNPVGQVASRAQRGSDKAGPHVPVCDQDATRPLDHLRHRGGGHLHHNKLIGHPEPGGGPAHRSVFFHVCRGRQPRRGRVEHVHPAVLERQPERCPDRRSGQAFGDEFHQVPANWPSRAACARNARAHKRSQVPSLAIPPGCTHVRGSHADEHILANTSSLQRLAVQSSSGTRWPARSNAMWPSVESRRAGRIFMA